MTLRTLGLRAKTNLTEPVRADSHPGLSKQSLTAHWQRLWLLAAIVLAAALAYQFMNVDLRYLGFAMRLRAPRLLAMLLTAFSIGTATVVFQSIINNHIVTPALLGMNSLYTLLHTGIVFFLGSASVFASNRRLAFVLDLVIMAVVATVVYSWLFYKTRYNVLYVLLAGTVLSNFFGSLQSSLVRVMDPNEYDALLNTLLASFNNVNSSILGLAAIAAALILALLRKELAMLDVIAMGKPQAVNLGIDYDRVIRKLLLGVTILIAVATALVGPLSFLGLISANLARRILPTYRHSLLIPGAALLGMGLLVSGQLLVEHVFRFSAPVSIFITVGGGIYFLYLLLRKSSN